MGHLRHRHRRTTLGLVAVACLVSLVGPAGAQVAPGPVTVERHGWWNFANGGPQSEAPSDPTAGLGLPTVPKPPTVPEGAVAVGASLGQADKVGAIGFSPLPVEEGATVTSFTLTLSETDDPGATQGADDAVIVACPVATFWIPGENGRWDTHPEADCDTAKVTGQRADDGTWTFDLTPVAAAWVDPLGTVAEDGILLQPEVEAPTSFQVSFADVAGEGARVEFSAIPGEPTDDPFATDDSFDTGGVVDDGGGFSDGGLVAGPIGGDTGGEPTAAPPTSAAPPAPPRPRAQPTAASGGTGWGPLLLLPLALGLALLMSMALGPAGEPQAAVREGGVSRALAARSRATPTPRPVMEAS